MLASADREDVERGLGAGASGAGVSTKPTTGDCSTTGLAGASPTTVHRVWSRGSTTDGASALGSKSVRSRWRRRAELTRTSRSLPRSSRPVVSRRARRRPLRLLVGRMPVNSGISRRNAGVETLAVSAHSSRVATCTRRLASLHHQADLLAGRVEGCDRAAPRRRRAGRSRRRPPDRRMLVRSSLEKVRAGRGCGTASPWAECVDRRARAGPSAPMPAWTCRYPTGR